MNYTDALVKIDEIALGDFSADFVSGLAELLYATPKGLSKADGIAAIRERLATIVTEHGHGYASRVFTNAWEEAYYG